MPGYILKTPRPFDYELPNVLISDGAMPPVDIRLHRDIGQITVAQEALADDFEIVLEPGHGVSVNDRIGMVVSNRLFAAVALAVNVNTITLDTPVNVTIPAGTQGVRAEFNLNVNGSTTRQYFGVQPPAGVVLDITRLNFEMIHGSAGDDSRFGSISALTRGIVIRHLIDGERFNYINIKDNGDLKQYAGGDLVYSDKAGGGKFSTSARATLSGQEKHGVVCRLRGPQMKLEVIIQDNLTGLDDFTIMAQGHYNDDTPFEIEATT